MSHLKRFFSRRSEKQNNILAIVFLIVSLIGLSDATFLTIEHFRGGIPPCTIADGCEEVLTSRYAEIFNIPVALGGSVYYATLFLLTLFSLIKGSRRLLRIAAFATFVGLLASLWFVSLQLFIIKAICPYCMLSASTSFLLFILGIFIIKKPT